MIKVKMYPADKGDAILVGLCSGHVVKNIIIDMGLASTYKEYIKNDLVEMNNRGESIDLLVITHIDEDHIQGALMFFEDNGFDSKIIAVNEVWYNSYRHLNIPKSDKILDEDLKILKSIISSQIKVKEDGRNDISAYQGSSLASILLENNYRWNTSFFGQAVCTSIKRKIEFDGFEIDLISPNQEKLINLSNFWFNDLKKKKYNFTLSKEELFDDAFEFMLMKKSEAESGRVNISNSEKIDLKALSEIDAPINKVDKRAPNGSSIAFILTFEGKKMLFLADSHDDIVIETFEMFDFKSIFFDLVKIPHHGSNNNYRKILSDYINSSRYLISTNGNNHGHPSYEVIAKVTNKNFHKQVIFNYPHDKFNFLFKSNVDKDFDVEYLVKNEILIE